MKPLLVSGEMVLYIARVRLLHKMVPTESSVVSHITYPSVSHSAAYKHKVCFQLAGHFRKPIALLQPRMSESIY